MLHSEKKMAIIQEENLGLLNEEMKVGPLVAETPAYAEFFETVGIDYCCKGKKTLKELCMEKNLDVTDILDKLKNLPTSFEKMDWSKLSFIELITHIKEKHHNYLKKELPRLSYLIEKVAAKHGVRHPELIDLQSTFEKFKTHLLEHIEQEDALIFPLIEELLTKKNLNVVSEDELKAHLISLDADHSESGAALEKMSALTDCYTPPKGACTTYLVLFNSLAFLEKDMHEHIHKENHVLFPYIAQMSAS